MVAQGNLLLIQDKVPTTEEFPLPTLGPVLVRLREEVRIGRGFALLRWVRPSRFPPTNVARLFAYLTFGLYPQLLPSSL